MYVKTHTLTIEDVYYCLYCGEKAKHKSEVDNKEVYGFYYCDCEGAQLNLERRKIEKRQDELKQQARPKIKKLKYLEELGELKKKYGIVQEVHND